MTKCPINESLEVNERIAKEIARLKAKIAEQAVRKKK